MLLIAHPDLKVFYKEAKNKRLNMGILLINTELGLNDDWD